MNQEGDINFWLEPHGADRGAGGRIMSKEILEQCVCVCVCVCEVVNWKYG